MLAVVILGLGILGLAALFAGLAKQQQTSTQIRRSVQVGLNVKSSLSGQLGNIEGVDPADLPLGQWAKIKSLGVANEETQLDISTLASGGRGNAFFRVNSPGEILFENPPDAFGAPTNGGAGLGTMTSAPFFDGGRSQIQDLSNGPVIPSSLRVTITISDSAGFGGGAPLEFTFRVPNAVTLDLNNPPTNSVTLRLNGDPASPGEIRMNLAEPTPGNSFNPPAITSFNLGTLFTAPSTQWISEIRVENYQWRNTTLLSLNERLSFVADDRFPPFGLRPDLGYVLFFRTLGDIAQTIVMTYALSPQSRPRLQNDDFPFVPPDHLDPRNDPGSIVRELEVDLGYDADRRQYFISVDKDSPTAWVATPRQILLMSSTRGFGVSTTADDPGADDVVRVVSQSLDPNDSDIVRGWLDDAPRRNLAAVLAPRRGAAPVSIFVYALNPEVTSATPGDNTRWRVSPVDARVIPVTSN